VPGSKQPSRRAADRLRTARAALACIIETGNRAGKIVGPDSLRSPRKPRRAINNKSGEKAPLHSASAAGAESRKSRSGA